MHLATSHRDRGKVLRRSVSCWRCAKEMPPPADEAQPYSCECGFVLPKKVQFLTEKEVDELNAALSQKRHVLVENSRHRSAEQHLDRGAKGLQRSHGASTGVGDQNKPQTPARAPRERR